jgi:hypothetical protein
VLASTQVLLDHLNWELFDHPPNSPDFAPSDYRLFTPTYQKRSNNNEESMQAVKTWLISQAADFFDTGIQKLLPR